MKECKCEIHVILDKLRKDALRCVCNCHVEEVVEQIG